MIPIGMHVKICVNNGHIGPCKRDIDYKTLFKGGCLIQTKEILKHDHIKIKGQ